MAQYCFAFLNRMAGFSFKLLPSDHNINSGDSSYKLLWDHSHDPQRIEGPVGISLKEFQVENMSPSRSTEVDPTNDVMIFPLIQCGQFEIREEERCFGLLFESMSQNTPHFDITSGYFNLYKNYQRSVINSEADYQILSASPKVTDYFNFHAHRLTLYRVSLGEWLLWCQRHIRSNTRGIHILRKGFLAKCH